MAPAVPTLLQLDNVSKSYAGVQALSHVGFSIARGEVRALLGANGAGKSTLIKILAGAVSRDTGSIYFEGRNVVLADPHESVARGIACVFQEPALVPFLTVEQNIFLGGEKANRIGLIEASEQRKTARTLLNYVAPRLSLVQQVGKLRTSERQLVALAKALLRRPKLLILDEPSASMSDPEIQCLFSIVRKLRDAGTSVLYVTHRLEEVFQIASFVTVLRDGRHIRSSPIEETNRAALINLIAGRELHSEHNRRDVHRGPPTLSAKNIGRKGSFSGISFQLHKGEILALAGLVGAGRTEIARSIIQADRLDEGTIDYPNPTIKVRSPFQAVVAGVVMIPEDRKTQGIIPKLSVGDNLILSSISQYADRLTGLIQFGRVRDTVRRIIKQLQIRPAGAETRAIETLSGGNQQKVLLARATESQARVLILDEPTAGVDVGAKAEIHRLILELVGQGKGIILISSEMEEILALADRILVIREGRMVRELVGAAASSLDILKSALGEDQRGEDDGV